MRYASGHTYQGNWENNMKNGQGRFEYVNGAVYTGAWVMTAATAKVSWPSCLEPSWKSTMRVTG